MRKLLTVFIIGFIAFVTHAADAAPPPSFTTLKEALTFIDHELDVEDWDGLRTALYPAFQLNDQNRTSWAQLKSERGKERLVDVFANRDFPGSGDTFIIGASGEVGAKMNGWSRIRFIKSDKGWHLNAIYGVK